MKKNDRVIRGGQRDMERERRELERTEKKLQEDIKKAAKQGNKQVHRCYMNYTNFIHEFCKMCLSFDTMQYLLQQIL